MITLNEPKTVASEQNFEVVSCFIDFKSGTIHNEISVTNENGEKIDTIVQVYKGEDANTYWENFNSKKYLYDKLVEEQELDIVVPAIDDVVAEL